MECFVTKPYNIYFTIRRANFHTTCFLNGWRQSANAMRKALGATRKKKIYFENSPKMPSFNEFSKGSFEVKQTGNSRRATVLNKLFMSHITDQLGTGKCAAEILGHGVEIIRVQITPDYKLLKVYWLARGTANDEIVQDILHRNSGSIRHELSQLRLMGVVPIITFVKDKRYSQIVELNNKIAVADFGEDYTPLDLAGRLKTEFEILSPLNNNIKKKLEELDRTQIEEYEEVPLPPMPQNVLGLNHADILDRIKSAKKKSEAPHRADASKVSDTEENWVTFKVSQPINSNPVELGDSYTQRIAFKEFLRKRQIQLMKAKQEKKNYTPDLEYIKEELSARNMEELSKFDISKDATEEDFIDEDFQ